MSTIHPFPNLTFHKNLQTGEIMFVENENTIQWMNFFDTENTDRIRSREVNQSNVDPNHFENLTEILHNMGIQQVFHEVAGMYYVYDPKQIVGTKMFAFTLDDPSLLETARIYYEDIWKLYVFSTHTEIKIIP